MNSTFDQVCNAIRTTGIKAKVIYDNQIIFVETDEQEEARLALNFDSYSGYINGVETIII